MSSELKQDSQGYLFREFTASELASIMDYSDGEFFKVLNEEHHVGKRLEYSRFVFEANNDLYQVELYMGHHEDYRWQPEAKEICKCYLMSAVNRVITDYIRVK